MSSIKLTVSLFLISLIFTSKTVSAQAIQSTSTSLDVTVAPGEILPVSVKLSNFGGGKRVDVLISYIIASDSGNEIVKLSETVAVETTNNFIKNIQIPKSSSEGVYTAKTSVVYDGQVTPANTEFSFKVEKKIFGIFKNQFYLYFGGIIIFGILVFIVTQILSSKQNRNLSRFSPIDYSNIDSKDRVFYELVSDTIMGMRHKVGDRALDIASAIEGLSINRETGRVIKLSRTPSKIIAELVLGYEKSLGQKISFAFREPRR